MEHDLDFYSNSLTDKYEILQRISNPVVLSEGLRQQSASSQALWLKLLKVLK